MKMYSGRVMIEDAGTTSDAPYEIHSDMTVDEMLTQARAAFEIAMADYERVLRQIYETAEAA